MFPKNILSPNLIFRDTKLKVKGNLVCALITLIKGILAEQAALLSPKISSDS